MFRKTSLKSAITWSFIFFIGYLILGFCIYNDYGISWDERVQRLNVGYATYDYVFYNNTFLFNNVEKYYGPFFETLLVVAEKALSLTDSRDIFLMRHLLTFLLFYFSALTFYLLCKSIFKKTGWALIGCTMLVVSPHIFSHSFYNSKDIPFLAFFIFSLSTFNYFVKYKNILWLILHSISCALLIDTRIIGIIIPLLTMVVFITEAFLNNETEIKKIILLLIAYVVMLFAFIYCCWPFLWPSPLKNLAEAFTAMKNFVAFDNTVLYLGNYIRANALPWHYAPVYLAITTPLLYLALFLIGIFSLFFKSVNLPFKLWYAAHGFILWMLLLFIGPLLAVIILKSILYDGWRHLFFIYPVLILIAVYGFRELWNKLLRPIYKKITALIVLLNFLPVLYFIIDNHPYQHVYYNALTGNMANAKDNFEMDYWGVLYKQGLEYIVKTDSSTTIKVHVANDPGILNSMILPAEQRNRLIYVDEIKQSDYFLTNYRWHKHNYVLQNECYSVMTGKAKIFSVFKMNE